MKRSIATGSSLKDEEGSLFQSQSCRNPVVNKGTRSNICIYTYLPREEREQCTTEQRTSIGFWVKHGSAGEWVEKKNRQKASQLLRFICELLAV